MKYTLKFMQVAKYSVAAVVSAFLVAGPITSHAEGSPSYRMISEGTYNGGSYQMFQTSNSSTTVTAEEPKEGPKPKEIPNPCAGATEINPGSTMKATECFEEMEKKCKAGEKGPFCCNWKGPKGATGVVSYNCPPKATGSFLPVSY